MVKSITDLIFSGGLEDLLADYMFGYGYMSYPGGAVLEDNLLKISLIATMMSTALWIIGILQIVFTYIALYKMYKLFNPNSAVAFLVVSILFNITQPFFIFSLRNRMPCYATAQPGGYPSYPQYPQYNDPPTGYAAPNAEPQAEPYATATVSAAVSEAVENIESPEEQQEAAAEDPWNRPE